MLQYNPEGQLQKNNDVLGFSRLGERDDGLAVQPHQILPRGYPPPNVLQLSNDWSQSMAQT
jgi:hypothetical protein